jgi:hypothetical protein
MAADPKPARSHRQSQNLTHWRDFDGPESLTTSRGLNRIHGQKNGPSVNSGRNRLRIDCATPTTAANAFAAPVSSFEQRKPE